MMQETLYKLESALKKNNPSMLAALNGPLTISAISEITIQRGISLPIEVQDLYQWKNGVCSKEGDLLVHRWLFPVHIFIPLSEAMGLYNSFPQMNQALSENWLTENLFPLFRSGGGELTLINIDETSPDFGSLFYFTLANPDIDIITSFADSLENLILAVTECYMRGVFCFDQNSSLVTDPHLECEVFSRYNPSASYWKQQREFLSFLKPGRISDPQNK